MHIFSVLFDCLTFNEVKSGKKTGVIERFFSGCNGLHTTAHNRFLGGIGGYNGLPTVMSGLDESLSDVTPRKKYPFELEKALHNVMFIQHHIQRQDEFNAVCIVLQALNKKEHRIEIFNFIIFLRTTGGSGLGFRCNGSR